MLPPARTSRRSLFALGLTARGGRRASAALALAAGLTLAGCASGGETTESAATTVPEVFVTPETGTDADTAASVPRETRPDDPARPRSPLADRVQPLGSALENPGAAVVAERAPVAITIESLGVTDAPIDPVGVEPNGEMEIPGAERVGWYRHGVSPGGAGSAVLAAHVAFDGVDGVFRFLTDLDADDTFTLTYDDGSSIEFVVLGRNQYVKDELPADLLFQRGGPPRVALITCGGSFNRGLNSYDDNVVAFAVPVDEAVTALGA